MMENKTKIDLKNKSIFITGVAGFIGSNLAKRLLSTVEGVKVVGLDNMNNYYDVRLKEARLKELEQFEKFSFVKGNLADKAVIESIFEQYKPEIVVNLGAQAGVRYSITNPDAYVEANLIGFYCLKRNYFLNHREWPYKDVKPRIIAEEYTVDESGYELKDYKIFCFNGEPKAMFIATDRGTDTKFDFFDTEFHHLPFTNGHPNADKEIKKPENFDEMLRIAGILSKGMPEVRVDLYNVNGKILFGEMTFFHWSGLMPFEPEEWDYKFGSWIELPEVR